MSDFRTQLFASVPAEKYTTFTCGHIVSPRNLLGAVVHKGPKHVPFEFTYEAWKRVDLVRCGSSADISWTTLPGR